MGQCFTCTMSLESRVVHLEQFMEGIGTSMAHVDQRLEGIQLLLARPPEPLSPTSDTLPIQECAYGEFVLLPVVE